MKKQILFLGILSGTSMLINAQSVSPDVIASGGDYYSNANGSISWTLGEPMGETYTSVNNILTQGFQQPWDFGMNIPNAQTPVNADAYPNPTTDVVNLQFGDNSNGVYVIEVCNTLGQLVSTTQFSASPAARTSVSLADFADGIFFITVRKLDGTETSTFKITKNS